MAGEPWSGPAFEDPALTRLAEHLAHAHRRVAPLPSQHHRRLIRNLLTITDLAKRDTALAARRLDAFLAELTAEFGGDPAAESAVGPAFGSGRGSRVGGAPDRGVRPPNRAGRDVGAGRTDFRPRGGGR